MHSKFALGVIFIFCSMWSPKIYHFITLYLSFLFYNQLSVCLVPFLIAIYFPVLQTPCGHNFCLKCFQKWIHNGERKCAKCRRPIPPGMASHPRINSALVEVIRMAKTSKNSNSAGSAAVHHYIQNDQRPDKAFTTDRAKKTGKANASSGQIFVTIAPDHFGPILAENDPKRNLGVQVGETWEDRLECRQRGAHFPHVAGIAGQSNYGAQSVALSGGCKDDEDHGEWFLYTGR
jgi:E3 ubiquitin-protein ligase UHRF1